MSFKTDQALWYNNGVWGQLGYAVPNFGNDPATLNNNIHYLVSVMGRNLQAVMHHPDKDLRVPPSINTLTRVHKLITRARSILAGRQVPPGTPDMEAVHSSPGAEEFIIFPVPYFGVRNPWMKQWCGLVLNSLAEAMQHTENRKPFEISLAFSGLVGQYLHRVYRLMATELFGVTASDAAAPDFALTDAQLAAYDPGKWFTATEMIDTVPRVDMVPTEDDLQVLTDGIPASKLVGLQKYPSGILVPTGYDPSTGPVSGTGSTATAASESFAPPPGP